MRPLPARSPSPTAELARRWLRERWQYDHFVPGAVHEEGLFARFSGRRLLVVRPWGERSGAWILKAGRRGRWRAVEPWLDVEGPNLMPPREGGARVPWPLAGADGANDARVAEPPWPQLKLPFPGDPVARAWNERAMALPRALALVPRRVRREVARVDPEFQWRLLRWIERAGPPGAELCRGNLALAVLLAAGRVRLGTSVARAVLWRRRRLAAAVGFPERAASVRLLAKVQCPSLRPELPRRLAVWAREPRALQRIAHAPRIGLAACTFQDAGELAWLADGLLLELLASDDRETLQALYRFTEAARSLQRRGHPVPGPVRSVARLRAETEAMLERLRHLRALPAWHPLPAPPLADWPGVVEALRSVGEIREEGERMRHCIVSYVSSAVAGRLAFYRVLRPERATLCLRPSRAGRGSTWQVDDLRLKANATPDPSTRAWVDAWLAGGR